MSNSDSEDEPPLAVPLQAPLQASDAEGGAAQASQAPPEPRASADAADAAADDAPPAAVPITLITGYLGAGKTTLVNHVLTAKHGYRCAVLLNEIADSADIERALVKEPEGGEAAPLADWTELENGCICCSAKNDMVKALEALMQQRSRFDYVLIETTGLANPGPVAAALWTDEQLESSVCLDCIVTVVDARHIERQLADPRPAGAVNEAQQQVAFADVVLLNKTDLAGEAQLARIERGIARMNATAALLRCVRCDIDLGRILNTGIYSAGAQGLEAAVPAGPDAGAEQQQQQQRGDEPEAECGDPLCGQPGQQHHHHASGGHDSRVGTVTVQLPERPLDLPALRRWLDALLWEQGPGPAPGREPWPADGGAETAAAAGGAAAGDTAGGDAAGPEVFRVKGLLHVAGSARKHVLQGVHDLYDVVEGPAWAAGELRRSKLVLIGRQLDAAALRAGLHACLAPEAGCNA